MYQRLTVIVFLFGGFAVGLMADAAPTVAKEASSISGVVFEDSDSDGIRDPGEDGLIGWRITLEGDTLAEESLKRETETDRDGFYSFENVPPGDYTVALPCEGQPELWVSTTPDGWSDYGLPVEGDDFEDIDFPLRVIDTPLTRDAAIAGRFVWDENRDGTPQPTEPGPGGWQVTASMLGSQCLPPEYQEVAGYTDSDGSFRFDDLLSGPYEIGAVGLNRTGDQFEYVQDYPGRTGRLPDGWEYFSASSLVEAPSDGIGTIEIGLLTVTGNGSIAGVLYRDLNLDGDRDPGEPHIAGSTMVGVMYRTPRGFALLGLRNIDATFELTGLAAGDFLVGVLLGGRPVNPPGGADGVPELTVTLAEGEHRTGVDFGFEPVPGEDSPETPAGAMTATPAATTATPSLTQTPGAGSFIGAPASGSGPSSRQPQYVPLLALAVISFALLAIGAATVADKRRSSE